MALPITFISPRACSAQGVAQAGFTHPLLRSDSSDCGFEILLPTSGFQRLQQVTAATLPQRQPKWWPARAKSSSWPTPFPHLPAGLILATLLAPGFLLPVPPSTESRGHSRLPAHASRELSTVTGKSHGRSAWFSRITETGLDLEAEGPWGPKATFERKPLLMYICMNLPDCLKILGDNSAFAYFFIFSKLSHSQKSWSYFFTWD